MLPSGMDPIAKRFMWDVISRISTRRGKTAVILTTHSMNEAQALCTRIGIMVQAYFLFSLHSWSCSMHPHIYTDQFILFFLKVGGQLRCIGSPQHLKTRFGNHLELEVFMVMTTRGTFSLRFLVFTFKYVILSFAVSR